mmetsp:Transcript_38189/g.61830  ORF Transcript_38189/g.61830 Transcript_38189/m.61830 type:complete len:160 (-) Transcript_38189:712-1191(-)
MAAAVETSVLSKILRMKGNVVSGFQRGSKLLGIPTANLSFETFRDLLDDVPAGVYFGWASVNSAGPYKTVLSIGWNPFFKNSQKTVEPYILHKFDGDFYGQELRLLVCGFIRPEADFSSLDALIEAIHNDIKVADGALDKSPYKEYQNDSLFIHEQGKL